MGQYINLTLFLLYLALHTPVDLLVNSILVAIVTHAKKSCNHHICHVGSSLRNPLKYGDIQSFIYQYFMKNPWVNDKGKFVKVGKAKVFNSMDTFHRFIANRYTPPLKVSYVALPRKVSFTADEVSFESSRIKILIF